MSLNPGKIVTISFCVILGKLKLTASNCAVTIILPEIPKLSLTRPSLAVNSGSHALQKVLAPAPAVILSPKLNTEAFAPGVTTWHNGGLLPAHPVIERPNTRIKYFI